MRSDGLPPLTPMAWLRYDLIQRLLPEDVGTVLEIGCGQGSVATRLALRCNYLGLEPDPASFAVASRRIATVGRGQVRCATDDSLPDELCFDLVCAFEVIEHLEDDEAALRRWVTRVVKGGWLMLSTPAHQSRFGLMDEAVGHYRRYDPQELADLMRHSGLTDVRVLLYGAPLGFVLEAGRDLLARKMGRRGAAASMAERSGASGRLLQPHGRTLGALTYLGTMPFRLLQRLSPRHGTGIVAIGRRM